MLWPTLVLLVLTSLAKANDLEYPLDYDEGDEALLQMLEERKTLDDLKLENDWLAKLDKVSCARHKCGAGRICQVRNEVAECVCIPECPDESDLRRQVCTNRNETWPSDCEVYRQKCLCDTNDPRCQTSDNKHMHIVYYGQCKQLPPCTEEEMNDFPRRMRDWLFNIMHDLADRDELSKYYLKMEEEGINNLTLGWAKAAVWKWCDLDGDPKDNSISRHELFPIRAPLLALEHCIGPFLDSCDANGDHRITLEEWGRCLEIDEDDMGEKCEEMLN